jgi:hypothetical protein
MAKPASTKTNGHAVEALKVPAAKRPAKAASKPAAKPSVKAAAKAPAKKAAKPAAKPAARPAAKPAAGAKPQAAPKKASAKPAAKPAVKPSVKPTPAPAAPEKVKKAKLVRDSFTMPELEYAILGQVKKACLKAGFEVKKSELLRIGVALISQIDLATLRSVLASLPQLKTGRPKNA